MHYFHPKRMRGDIEDGIEHVEIPSGVNDDSKDSLALKGKTILPNYGLQIKLTIDHQIVQLTI